MSVVFSLFGGARWFHVGGVRGAGIYSQTLWQNFFPRVEFDLRSRRSDSVFLFIVGSSGLCLWCFRFLQEPGDFMSVVWGVREFIARPFGENFSLVISNRQGDAMSFIVGSSGLWLWCLRFLEEAGDFMSVVWGVREFDAKAIFWIYFHFIDGSRRCPGCPG